MLAFLIAAALEFTPADAHFAYEQAKALVERCTPRDAGTVRGRIAANHLLDAASAAGADVRCDTFRAMTPRGEREFTNLYGVLGSRASTRRWVVLVSHYDTKAGCNCPGANDGASTCGLLVALANAYGRLTAPKGNLLLVWTDGEECMQAYGPNDGLWGARRAAERLIASERPVQAVICLDMLGDRDLSISIPANGSEKLRKIALLVARKNGFDGWVRPMEEFVKDDHQPFADKGFPAIDLIDFHYGPDNSWWHTREDTVDKLSEESLLKSGKFVTALLNVLM